MVALVIGIVVSTATLAIVITSVHLSSDYNDRVDANQQGRTAMLKITQALNSSCVASAVAPILSASDSNDVWFYSLLGDSPTLYPSQVEISLTGGGSLVMTTYPYASVFRLRIRRRAVDDGVQREPESRQQCRHDRRGRGQLRRESVR